MTLRTLVLALLVLAGSSAALWDPTTATLRAASGNACTTTLAWDAKACALAELQTMVLPSGRRVYTHGPDGPLPHEHGGSALDALLDQVPAPTLRQYPYVCVTDPGQYHNRVVYARAFNAADRYAEFKPKLENWTLAANTMLHAQSLDFDVATDYRMLCDAGGSLVVDHVVMPTPLSSANIYAIMADAEAAGYTSTKAKYWILYDDPGAFYCGQGEFAIDPTAGPSNQNNVGPSYAVTWPNPDCGEAWVTLMHENGHNLGAVQPLSPNSDRYAHCQDGADVMCYLSVPPVVPAFGVRHALQCAHLRFDCGNDDYFHPKPAELSYLAHFWNLGARHNRFFAFADVPAAPTGVAADGADAGQATVSWSAVTGSPAPTAYRVYHGDASLGTMTLAVEVAATQTSATFASDEGFFVVTAVGAGGESRPSGIATRDA